MKISAVFIFKRALIGALIGFGIISLFVFTVTNPNPEWGENWKVRPLIVTPLATALATLSFLLKNLFEPKRKWVKALVVLISTVGFAIGLWLGVVLGLDGTLWN